MKQNIFKKVLKFFFKKMGLISFVLHTKYILSLIFKLVSGEKRFEQLFNSFKHRLNLLGPKANLNFGPKVLSLVLTQKCNLHCSMCMTHSESVTNNFSVPKDMSMKLFHDIINKYSCAEMITFIGNGEPLLHPELFNMISLSNQRKFDTLLVTNGTLLEKHAMNLIHAKPHSIYISINGYDEKDYARLTGEKTETFQIIKKNIKTFTSLAKSHHLNIFIGCSFICDQVNYKHMQNMLDLSKELGANLCVLNNFLDSDCVGYRAQERCLYDNESYRHIINELVVPMMDDNRLMTVVLPVPLKEINNDCFCDSFFTMLRIDGDGDIGGCGRKLLELKNNGQAASIDCWNNNYFLKHREGFIKGEVQHIEKRCLTCFNSHLGHRNKR